MADDRLTNAVRESARRLHRDVDEQLADVFGRHEPTCESPIERLFLAAMCEHLVRDPYLNLAAQVPIPPYRVDFVVRYAPRHDLDFEVVVECDGHDFHDRTKEQAERDKSRDRFITADGRPVMRFTGREINRDPHGCAEEVIDYLQDLMYRHQMRNATEHQRRMVERSWSAEVTEPEG